MISALIALALLLAAPIAARADASGAGPPGSQISGDLELLGEAAVNLAGALIRELSRRGGEVLRDYVEAEAWHGPAIDPGEYVGELRLKLYPHGKSKSREHLKADTWYRLSKDGLKELEIKTSRGQDLPDPDYF